MNNTMRWRAMRCGVGLLAAALALGAAVPSRRLPPDTGGISEAPRDAGVADLLSYLLLLSRNVDSALSRDAPSPNDAASGTPAVAGSSDHLDKANVELIRQRLAQLNSMIDAFRQANNAVAPRERVGAGSPNWPAITQFSDDFIKNFGSESSAEQYRSMTPFSVLTQFGPPTEISDNSWIWATQDPRALSGSASMRIEFSGSTMSKVDFPRQ